MIFNGYVLAFFVYDFIKNLFLFVCVYIYSYIYVYLSFIDFFIIYISDHYYDFHFVVSSFVY